MESMDAENVIPCFENDFLENTFSAQSSGGISRKQISDITGLSWGGMTKIVNKLMEHEYIVEEKNISVWNRSFKMLTSGTSRQFSHSGK